MLPFHETPRVILLGKSEVPDVEPVHVIPSYEYARVSPPEPPIAPAATHILPLHATAKPVSVITELPDVEAVHVIPSDEYKI
jgi:hypothetical protein